MRFSANLIAVLATAASCEAAPSKIGAKSRCSGLYNAIKSRGLEFMGTALTIRDEPQENTIISDRSEFNSVTPENAQKWESIEPARGVFTFADADRHVEYATSRNMQIHCHTLVWHSQLPAWVSQGNFDNATLIQIMKDHIDAVAGRYKGRCTRWDVVNEALNEDGTYRESVFYNTIGEAYIPLAFQFARAADPKAKLWYNDFNLEYGSAKTAGAQRIVELIQSYSTRRTSLIDAVGFQGHVASESTPTSPGPAPEQSVLEGSLRSLTKYKIDVAYTEIDVRMNTPATPARLEVQARAFERVARSCLAVKRCIGMTVWGVSDEYSWIPDTFQGEGAALLWDEEYRKKPAYKGFLQGILGWKGRLLCRK